MSTGKPKRSLVTLPREDLARYVGIGVLTVYAILFIVLNTNKFKINFVFFQLKVSVLVALILAAAIGVAGGWMLRGRSKGTITHPPR
jgi:uncharacterized integral membrane protein